MTKSIKNKQKNKKVAKGTLLAGKPKSFWDAQIADAIKNGKAYTDVKELFKDLGID